MASQKRHDIKLEIVEGGCYRHKLGSKLVYPRDRGKMCEWLLASAFGMLSVLRFGGTLPWSYKGTPYEKLINEDGVTTEFIRCPDPTSMGVVLKLAREITK